LKHTKVITTAKVVMASPATVAPAVSKLAAMAPPTNSAAPKTKTHQRGTNRISVGTSSPMTSDTAPIAK
jgi:hypothetical protein